MKQVRLAVCVLDDTTEEILAKKELTANWTVDVEESLERDFATSILDEIAYVVCEQSKRCLDKQFFLDLFDDAGIIK
jgi:hypothetical protein